MLENRLCFNCLRPEHQGHQCRSFKRCQVCNRKHDTLLHEEGLNTLTTKAYDSSVSKGASHQGQKINMAAARLSTDTNYNNRRILLMTAAAKARSTTGEHKDVRIFFDSGAQASFVSRSFAAAVKVEVLSHARGNYSRLRNKVRDSNNTDSCH